MRFLKTGLVVLSMIFCPAQLMARGAAPGCELGEAQPVNVKALTQQFDLALEDGRVLRLAGLYPSFDRENPILAKIIDALMARLKDDVVLVREVSPLPDRWGRISAQVAIVGADGEPQALAPLILSQGGAMVRPEPEIADCLHDYLDAENEARSAGAGLWGSNKFTVFPAALPDTMIGQDGRFTLVEGEVARFGEGETRVFLDFSMKRGLGFSVSILKKSLKAFQRAGLDPAGFVGKTLRVRGTLDMRFAPRMEISAPDAIEILP